MFLWGIIKFWCWGNIPLLKFLTNKENYSFLEKAAIKVLGWHSLLHPEDPSFFCNLVGARKLLMMARQIQEQRGEKPKIALNLNALDGNMVSYRIFEERS